MAIGALPPVGVPGPIGVGPTAGSAPTAGFGDALAKGLETVSALEQKADGLATSVATGGPTKVHDLMIATSQAGLAVDLLVQVRNRAVEAYQEIMRMPL